MLRDKQIDNSIYILGILRNIGRTRELQATAFFDVDNFEQGVLIYVRKEKKLYFKPNSFSENYIVNSTLNISFLLKETVFEFNSTIVDIIDNHILLDSPKIFRSSFKRKYSRYSPTINEDIYVQLPDGSNYSVKDVTTAGVSFYSKNLNLNIGYLIRNLCIIFNNSLVCIDARVKYTIETSELGILYGTEFVNMDWFANYTLFKYIFSKTYPNIKEITDFSKDVVYQLYKDSNYFDLKPREEMQIAFNKMFELMNKIKIYPHIISNPVYYYHDRIYMGASALRIYNNTFLSQHLAAIPQARLFPASKSAIYLGLNDYFLCNPYFKYYLTYFDATSKWHHKMYQSIGSYIEDETKFIYDTVEYFECNYDKFNIDNPCSYSCEILNNKNEFIYYAKANFKSLYNDSYGYNKKDIELNEMKQLFEMANLNAQREIIKITKNGKIMAFGVVETYTSGLNLYNILDMLRLHIVDETGDINEIFIAAIKECRYFFYKYNKSKLNIFVKLTEAKRDLINIEGVNYDFLVGTVLANRVGSVEYKNLFLNMTR